jgi:hypothetical protein
VITTKEIIVTTYIYDPENPGAALPELPPLPIGSLVVGALNLLDEAADLPQPRHLTVCDAQAIIVQFDEDPASLRAITRWALRFGGVLVTQPHHDENGMVTYCHTEFSYYGVATTAYAFLPAPPGATTCSDPSCDSCGHRDNPAAP